MVALYLHRQGCTCRYIAEKLDVSKSVVSKWLNRKEEINNKNKERLEQLLFEFILEQHEIDWYET